MGTRQLPPLGREPQSCAHQAGTAGARVLPHCGLRAPGLWETGVQLQGDPRGELGDGDGAVALGRTGATRPASSPRRFEALKNFPGRSCSQVFLKNSRAAPAPALLGVHATACASAGSGVLGRPPERTGLQCLQVLAPDRAPPGRPPLPCDPAPICGGSRAPRVDPRGIGHYRSQCLNGFESSDAREVEVR